MGDVPRQDGLSCMSFWMNEVSEQVFLDLAGYFNLLSACADPSPAVCPTEGAGR